LEQFSFGDFPESDGATQHEPGGSPGEPREEDEERPVEEQVDDPEFIVREPADTLKQAIQDEAGDVRDVESRRTLSAEGKHAISFGDESVGFSLPEYPVEPEVALALPDGEEPEVAASLPVPGAADITIPSSVAELSRGNHGLRQVALTFDDGPHQEYTEQLLSILEYYDVPATFFFVGIQCVKYPQYVKMAHDGGHEIGSQTYDHFRMPQLPREEKEYQIDEYQLLIERLCGVTPKFMRPPGGQVDDQTRNLLKQRGMVLALWDVALNDTRDGKTAAEMLETAKRGVRPGSVILAHDGIKATVELLPQLIEELRRQGYGFVTMSQLAAGL
jgi:peptidoglycan/xylan/chitin deacetylase (PgdA/CDA1 family)